MNDVCAVCSKKHNLKWTRRFMLCAFLVPLSSFLISTTTAQAQNLRFGLRGGADVINMEYSGDVFKASNRSGFFVGPTLKINTPITGFSIDVGALYSQRDLKVDDNTMTQKSLLLPGNARMGVGLGDLLGIFLSVGPQFSFNLGTSAFYWEDLEGYRKHFTLQETTLSLNFGAGVSLGHHLEASVYYNLPIGKTADFTWDTMLHHLEDQTMHRAESTVNAWHLSVAYYF